jgi:plastocyanin
MSKLGVLLIGVALPALFGTPARRTVEIAGFAYKPIVVEAQVGDTIVWLNRDIVPHTATASGAWDTGAIPAKSSARTVMRKKGEYDYKCIYHSNMKGKLVVR